MKKLLTLLTFTLFLSINLFAQTDSTAQLEPPLTIVSQMPEFFGGEAERIKFIQTNIVFPEAEKKAKISGTCYVTFVVEKDGSLSGIKIIRGVKDGPGYDAETLRLVKTMPKWNPGQHNGKVVRVKYNLPIKFKL